MTVFTNVTEAFRANALPSIVVPPFTVIAAVPVSMFPMKVLFVSIVASLPTIQKMLPSLGAAGQGHNGTAGHVECGARHPEDPDSIVVTLGVERDSPSSSSESRKASV